MTVSGVSARDRLVTEILEVLGAAPLPSEAGGLVTRETRRAGDISLLTHEFDGVMGDRVPVASAVPTEVRFEHPVVALHGTEHSEGGFALDDTAAPGRPPVVDAAGFGLVLARRGFRV